MKTIILTGGGTAGHVTPNLALVPGLAEAGYTVKYIGSLGGMEEKLATDAGLEYHGIATGKLRRYFDPKNFTDPFRVLKGFAQARRILKRLRPDVVFSKGGFVGVPVAVAARSLGIPVILHESDLTPGLANRICMPFCAKICYNFPETAQYLPSGKSILTGQPIRRELLEGDRAKGARIAGFSVDKPVILVIGGSLGSVAVNAAIRCVLPDLLRDFQVIHICGKGNTDETLMETPGYAQFEYVGEPLKDLFAVADIAVSRAGANAICELLSLQKPHVLIPLSTKASRGDQILNAASFARQGFSATLQEEDLSPEALSGAIRSVYENRDSFIGRMRSANQGNAIETIVGLVGSYAKA
ncbi:MAG: undecaprenyldiphospho-muramoylpentapeptide beta-N-acetylglucosaminyltransferase [Lachnospiraceae bacterium]|jgi:UDP-N-acetylglucosamine--N-acetylmuramyl-(pentapeptide) pyrophosphoryl-undecaprenol N-acetylglucosamine transferase|nr:undecaprenyldiphospho-muramoylpentapeptide beta-N-acetylglucosaminyltransferase [Lachnospiraceae bacterium]